MASSSSIAAIAAVGGASIAARSSKYAALRWKSGPRLQVSLSRSRECRWRRGWRVLPGVAAVLEEKDEGSSVAVDQMEIGSSEASESSEPSSLAESVEEGNGDEENVVLTPEDEERLECVDQIRRILELLKNNRDMTPNEVRLIVMIEDPRDSENRGMLTEDGEWTSFKDEMGNVLIDVSEGKIPQDLDLLRALRDELFQWPNFEEMADKRDPRKSSYAQVTDTGVDPVFSGDRAKVDWDEAAEIVPGRAEDNSEKVPPAVGYSLLYFVSLLPILIGVAVVAILFLNSFQ